MGDDDYWEENDEVPPPKMANYSGSETGSDRGYRSGQNRRYEQQGGNQYRQNRQDGGQYRQNRQDGGQYRQQNNQYDRPGDQYNGQNRRDNQYGRGDQYQNNRQYDNRRSQGDQYNGQNQYNNRRSQGDQYNNRRDQYGGDQQYQNNRYNRDNSNGGRSYMRPDHGAPGHSNLYNMTREERFGDASNDCQEEFFISSIDCSLVIGRGGETIKGIQQQFGVKINIDKNTHEFGKASVKITGCNSDDIQKAIQHIKDLCPKPEAAKNEGGMEVPMCEDGTIDYEALNKRCEEARRERWAKCPTMIKNFYNEQPEVANMTASEVAKFREEHMNISVSRTFPDKPGGDAPIPNPITTFDQAFSEYPDLMDEIHKAGFTTPSPIQTHAWPVLLKGEDLIGIAQTGTGKTLAFLLPALIHIDRQPVSRDERGGPNVLIMAPTRELALQIQKEAEKYQYRGIRAVCLYGGGERKLQIQNVKSGVQIIIATPGRLNDLVAANVLEIESVTYLVLDEADRMLDMGFEPQIRKLLLDIRPDRQTVMTSATWPPGVRRLAASYMSNPIQVFVGSLDLAATHTVTQEVRVMEDDEKFNALMHFIDEMSPTDKAIIFCGKKSRADDLASDLALKGISNQSIHGSREQSDREQALADIKSGAVRILVATDVASRGIDIEDITHVINFDFPRNIEEYVHRVGRTGRAGRNGKSISFFTRSDWSVAAELIGILNEAEQEVPEGVQDMADRFKAKQERMANEKEAFGLCGGRGGGGGFGRGGRSNGDNFGTDCAFSSIVIEKHRVGGIIGKGGSTIREIQDTYHVRVDIDKNFVGNPEEAKVNVKGRSHGEVQEAISHIKRIISRSN